MGGLTEAKLAQMAGKRSFERGLGYTDAVSGIEVGDGWIRAFVHGTERYEAELLLGKRGRLSGRCDCPYGQEGNFCKHLVALGLTVIEQEKDILQRGELAATEPAASTPGCPACQERNCSHSCSRKRPRTDSCAAVWS